MRAQAGTKSPKWLRDTIELAEKFARDIATEPSIATAVSEIDALKAENSALRDELHDLRNTDVGELAARCDELWAENQQLRAQLRRKS